MKIYSIRGDISAAAADGLKEGARALLAEARSRVPVDDGELRRSGRVRAEDLEATVSFTAPHAWLQHEKTEYQHPNGGEAKYLENAALAYPLAQPIADHVRARLGGG